MTLRTSSSSRFCARPGALPRLTAAALAGGLGLVGGSAAACIEIARPVHAAIAAPESTAAAAHRDWRAVVEALSDEQVGRMYVDCGNGTPEGRLGSGETALCSIVYEVLLERHFKGDFDALAAWSRSAAVLRPGSAPIDAGTPGKPVPPLP
jgi:hypothetical protein